MLEIQPSHVEDFSQPGRVEAWHAVDDVVMGGRSRSRLRASGSGSAFFEGELVLTSGNGFASVHSPEREWRLGDGVAIAVRARGDGRRYKLGLRCSPGRDGVVYQASFQPPADAWTLVALPWHEFVPCWRGREVKDAPPLDPAGVCSLALYLADGREGPFQLELAWIGVVPPPESRC